DYADAVLPAPTFLEKEDLVIPWGHGYVRLSERAVPPVTDSRTELWVAREIARRLGLKEEWLFEDPWTVLETAVGGALEGGDFRALMSGKMLRLRTRPKGEFPTPSGRIEFCSTRAAQLGLSPLPAQAPLRLEGGEFILLTSATPHYTNTQFQEVYGPIPAVVTMSPGDAGRLGIQDGDEATLANERGRVRMKVMVSDTVLEGVLWAPSQSEALTGEPLNCLTSCEPQKIGRGPRFNSTTVTVAKSV
ncbi:MAG: molybdopterin-dependent oxidoreductase, partial [Candidatus Eiseniibacteriota bacterium]